MIISSLKTMKKIALNISESIFPPPQNHLDEIMLSERKFNAINFRFYTAGFSLLKSILDDRGENITSLSIEDVTDDQFHLIMKLVPNLEHLRVTRSILTSIESISLPKLKVCFSEQQQGDLKY